MKSKDDLKEIKYARVGHENQGRKCDEIVQYVTSTVGAKDSQTLPPRWSWKNRDHFLNTYGHGVMWAKTQSYHLLMLDGMHAVRIWTDSPDSCLVDISPNLVEPLRRQGFEIESIPKSSQKKTKPMVFRTRVFTERHAMAIVITAMLQFIRGN